MTRRCLLLGLVGFFGMLGAVSDGSAAPAAFTWGKALEVPATATLNTGGHAFANSVSCPAAGNCTAGGSYQDGSGFQAFVVNEKNGTWGKAVKVPGTATLNAGGDAAVSAASCTTTRNCSAAGTYADGSGHRQAFVVSEKNGTWTNAVEVPGTATLNAGGSAGVNAISCPTARNCSAAGYYTDGALRSQTFVATETNGTWGDAIEVPGTAALDSTGHASLRTLSCGAPGDCALGGYYVDGSGNYQAFVASATNGTWSDAVEVPGTAALNAGGQAYVESVSCGAPGHCTAGGYYLDGSGNLEAFLVSETNGAWGEAFDVPGMATLNTKGAASLYWISCATADACAAGGYYTDDSEKNQAFVINETNGTWGNAIKVPGLATINTGAGGARVYSISCADARDCSAGGYYTDGSEYTQAFVVNETNGTWGKAIKVPGTAALNAHGNAKVYSISCADAGNCAAAGYYKDSSSRFQAFVVDSLPPCVVPNVVGKRLATAKQKLKAAHCGVGRIKNVYSTAKRGRVVTQNPKHGKHLANGAKVALTVSKGSKS